MLFRNLMLRCAGMDGPIPLQRVPCDSKMEIRIRRINTLGSVTSGILYFMALIYMKQSNRRAVRFGWLLNSIFSPCAAQVFFMSSPRCKAREAYPMNYPLCFKTWGHLLVTLPLIATIRVLFGRNW